MRFDALFVLFLYYLFILFIPLLVRDVKFHQKSTIVFLYIATITFVMLIAVDLLYCFNIPLILYLAGLMFISQLWIVYLYLRK